MLDYRQSRNVREEAHLVETLARAVGEQTYCVPADVEDVDAQDACAQTRTQTGDPNQDLPLFQDPHCLQGKAFAEAKSVDVATHHRHLQEHLEPY